MCESFLSCLTSEAGLPVLNWFCAASSFLIRFYYDYFPLLVSKNLLIGEMLTGDTIFVKKFDFSSLSRRTVLNLFYCDELTAGFVSEIFLIAYGLMFWLRNYDNLLPKTDLVLLLSCENCFCIYLLRSLELRCFEELLSSRAACISPYMLTNYVVCKLASLLLDFLFFYSSFRAASFSTNFIAFFNITGLLCCVLMSKNEFDVFSFDSSESLEFNLCET